MLILKKQELANLENVSQLLGSRISPNTKTDFLSLFTTNTHAPHVQETSRGETTSKKQKKDLMSQSTQLANAKRERGREQERKRKKERERKGVY